MEDQYKEVHFHEYCKTCIYKDTDEGEDPCDGCLSTPENLYSHKPVNYKKDEDAK